MDKNEEKQPHRKLFTSCECGCSTVVVTKYDDDVDDSIALSLLTHAGQSYRLTLKEAIIVACRALFKRHIHEDFTILCRKDAENLGMWLLENTYPHSFDKEENKGPTSNLIKISLFKLIIDQYFSKTPKWRIVEVGKEEDKKVTPTFTGGEVADAIELGKLAIKKKKLDDAFRLKNKELKIKCCQHAYIFNDSFYDRWGDRSEPSLYCSLCDDYRVITDPIELAGLQAINERRQSGK